MAETLPSIFLKTGEGAIVSYDFVDLSEGTGIIVLYAGVTKNSTSETAILQRNTFFNYEGSTKTTTGRSGTYSGYEWGTSLDQTFTLKGTKTFELTAFNMPQRIGGNMLVQIPFGSYSTDYGSVSPVSHAIVTVYKDTTSLATATSEDATGLSAVLATGIYSFNVAIPATSFKKGEQLKIKVECFLKRSGAAAEVAHIWAFDPQDTAITTLGVADAEDHLEISGTTQLKFFVPFKIDL